MVFWYSTQSPNFVIILNTLSKKLFKIKNVQIISAYEAEQHKKMYGYNGGDLTSPGSTELTSVCYEYSYPDNNCNTSKNGIYAIGKTVSEHHYEQPMVILPSRSPVDSIVKPLISDTSSSSTGGNFRACYQPLQIGTCCYGRTQNLKKIFRETWQFPKIFIKNNLWKLFSSEKFS